MKRKAAVVILFLVLFSLIQTSYASKIWHSGQNVALNMKTTVSSTDNYDGCNTTKCKQIPAFGRSVVDGSIKTCFRSLKEDSPWLMVHLEDYYPIFLVRIATSGKDLHRVKVYAGDSDKRTIGRRRNNLPLFAFKDGKIPKKRQLSFGCDELYVYGNAVKIETDSAKSVLSLCEVEVYVNPYVNIALNQFSEGKTGDRAKPSELAHVNDGNLKTCFTFSPRHPYWYLELGVNVRVSVVYILHAPSTNLKGFDIVVGKDSGKTKGLCITIPKYDLEEGVGNYFECKKPVVGNFLNITLKHVFLTQISLCEVEVYQTTIINVAAKRFTQSDGKNPNKGVDQKIDTVFSVKAAKSPTWIVKMAAVCDIHLIRIITDVGFKPADYENLVIKAKVSGPGFGKVIARLRNAKKEVVQTITLPNNTRARFVTFKIDRKDAIFSFREIEIYNKPLFDVDECRNPNVSCPANHKCQNLPNSYKCICDGGFHMTGRKKNECKDIDECSKNTNKCNINATCTNTVGSYKCTCKPGFAGDGVKICSNLEPCKNNKDCEQNQDCKNIKGTKLCDCKKGYLDNGKDKQCIDQDECKNKDNICGLNSNCTNTPGSYKCNCLAGYESKNDVGKNCFDKDECEAKKNPCGEETVCTNTIGSFKCSCPDGFFHDYDKKGCYDVDECANSTSCGLNMECNNTVGSYSCSCLHGYRAEINQKNCIDIDECSKNTNKCNIRATCTNTVGSYKCTCNPGFAGDGIKICSSLTPCKNNKDCEQNQDCKSIKGTKLCDCKKGYLNNGKDKQCIDKDECEAKENPCGDVKVCKNTIGSFKCSCPDGFVYDNAEKICYDVDECRNSTSCGLNMECNNTVGSYSCSCLHGYRAEINQKNCIDIDECEEGTYTCPKLTECENKIGGYECLCKTGYEKTKEAKCSEICTPKCDENSFCENGECLCREGFTLGLEQKCQSIKGLSGTGMSLRSSAILLAANLRWCRAFMISC